MAFAPWLLVALPAIILLVEILPLLVAIPCLDAWSFVQQYQHWVEDRYSWAAFLAPHYVHPSVVGKVIYFAVLHLLGGNVAVLPVLSWAFSAVTLLCTISLARPLWKSSSPGCCAVRPLGIIVLIAASLVIFTAAQGEVWIWDFVFQNFIPGTCLAVGLWLLSGKALTMGRWVALSALSIVSIFSFGAGFCVPALLTLPLALAMVRQGCSRVRLVGTLAVWLLVHAGIAWFALSAPGGAEDTERLGLHILWDRPHMRLHFVLIVLGNILGKGTVVEPETLCAVFGGALLAIFLACLVYLWRHRRDAALLERSVSWMSLAGFGLCSAVLISLGRMHNSLDNALDERFATFDVFFVLGTLMIAATVLDHLRSAISNGVAEVGQAEIAGAWPVWYRPLQHCVMPAFVILVLALMINWHNGHNLMLVKHSRMAQERAVLTFAKVMPLDKEWMDARVTRKSSQKLAAFLESHDRLNGVQFAETRELSQFKRGPKANAKWSRLDPPTLLENGDWQLSGMGGLAVDNAAALVLVTAQSGKGSEQIIALTAPVLPATFFEREKQVRLFPEYFLGWSQVLPVAALPDGVSTIRAYVFDPEKRTVHPIQGTYEVGHGGAALARTQHGAGH